VEHGVHERVPVSVQHQFNTEVGFVGLEVDLFLAELGEVVCQAFDATVGGDDEAQRASSGVLDDFTGLGFGNLDHAVDERAGREVLARAALAFLGVLLKQAFVEVGKSAFLPGFIPLDGVNLGDKFLEMARQPNSLLI
jgi:hypothetical protein